MTNGLKGALAITGVLVIAVGIRVGLIYKANHEAGPARVDPYANIKVDPDANVFLRKERPDSLADERTLIGKTVWISAGGQMDFYKDTGNHVDYAHPAGILLGAEPLLIKGVFEQVPPRTGRAVARIAAGQKHVLLAFTKPNSADPHQLYAFPVGNYDEGSYNLYTDEILFYDDPHQLYSFWGPTVWAHIDMHEAAPGMTEDQAMMALGQVMDPHGDTIGNRSVTYDNNGHPITIDFENNRAVKITPAS